MMDQSNISSAAPAGVPRRTIVKGVAWSVPVIAATIAAPMASASGVALGGTSPTPSGVCGPAGSFSITVTNNGTPVVGTAVTVTLPDGFSWPGGVSNPQVFSTDSSGTVNITGVTGPSVPGTYAVTASATIGGVTSSTSIPVSVQGVWVTGGPGFTGTRLHNVYTNPADVGNLGATSCVAYCVEHNNPGPSGKVGHVGDPSTHLGNNAFNGGGTMTNFLISGTSTMTFTAAQVQAKIEWIMRHAYPQVTLSALAAAAGLTGSLASVSANVAIEAAQYAIWSYTDEYYVDSNWNFGDGPGTATYDQGKAIFTYLANGAWNDTATAPSSCVKVLSSASADCATPTAGNHMQSLAMVCDC